MSAPGRICLNGVSYIQLNQIYVITIARKSIIYIILVILIINLVVEESVPDKLVVCPSQSIPSSLEA
jgi:hypothetical protein